MIKIALVGCTGKLGKTILKRILDIGDVELRYAIARRGNQFVGKSVSELVNDKCDLKIIDDIELAVDCDVFIDCTNADAFMNNGYAKYEKMGIPLVLATTAFSQDDVKRIKLLSTKIPVFMSGNFSVTLHNFIETLKFAVKRMSDDTDVQIVESHHNQKLDAPSGTALMIRDALISANPNLSADRISICSVRVGKIFGEHEVIFANNRDEIVTYKHQVMSREPFADGAINVAEWILAKPNGLYGMGDFCDD
ncbi:MAG: 4-hydroxy-tetrahydrodipicolinate reductase [Clostridia bacterium]|nr:4-hydroxy-tetrahydrodipicolinate reductase [Clostridia bacterium]